MEKFIGSSYKRIVLYSILILFILLIIIINFDDFPFGLFPDDFFAYWSSGQLMLRGENPYSRINSMQISQEVGFDNVGLGLSFFYPPWTLPFLMPFSIFTYKAGRSIWLAFSLLILIISSSLLWTLYDGSKKKRWISILLLLSLGPLLFALVEGQVSPLILLGLTGFLYFERNERYLLSGMFLGLATFKIHILYIFWIALILWIIKFKRWKVLFGFLLVLALMTIIAIIADRNIILEYILMNFEGLPRYCNNPTLSSIICSLTGSYNSWYLLLAPTFGLIFLFYFWHNKNDSWQWKQTLPVLIPVSLLSAPYVWMHDNLLFLIAVVEVSILIISFGISWKLIFIILVYFLTSIIAFISVIKLRYDQIIYILLPVLFFSFYLISKQILNHPKEIDRKIQV